MSENTPPRQDAAVLASRERLARIFNPEATRQRLAAFQRQGANPGLGGYLRFAHYTTAEAGLKILQTKRLWMRNTTSMADFREVRHGYDILLKYFKDDRAKAFRDAFDKAVPGVAHEALTAFDSWWNANNALNVYASSFSEHSAEDDEHGRLSMWRAFGANAGARVALIFRLPYGSLATEALSLIFSPVAYLSDAGAFSALDEVVALADAQHEFIATLPRNELLLHLFTMLYAGVTCVKHEGFKEEREWRAVYNPQIWRSNLLDLNIETIGGIPQHVHKIPLDGTLDPRLADVDLTAMLESVIIGPSQYPWVIRQAFAEELDKLHIPMPQTHVRVSGIPIRS